MTFKINYPKPDAPLIVIFCDSSCIINKEKQHYGLVWEAILADSNNNKLVKKIDQVVVPVTDQNKAIIEYDGKLRSIYLGMEMVKKDYKLSDINLRIFTQQFYAFYNRLSNQPRYFLRYDFVPRNGRDILWKSIIKDLRLVAGYEICTAYWTDEELELIRESFFDTRRAAEKLAGVPPKAIDHYYGYNIARIYV